MSRQKSSRPILLFREPAETKPCAFCLRPTHYRARDYLLPVCFSCADRQYVERLPTPSAYRQKVVDYRQKGEARQDDALRRRVKKQARGEIS